MRILQIHNHYRLAGGEDSVVTAEAELLREAGHEVIQLLAENPAGSPRALGRLALSAWNPLAARKVRRLARDRKPDVAHVHNTWFSLTPSVLPALRRAGVPVAMTLHNYRLACANAILFRDGQPCELCLGASPWPGLRHRCYRGSLLASLAACASIALHRRRRTWQRDVDLFLALTSFASSRLVAAGLPASKLAVKPNFTPDPGPRPRPPSASRRLLYVGRLVVEKGLRVLAEAWQGARPASLELLVVGEGPLAAELESLRLPGIRLTARMTRAEVREAMLSSRALLLPSIWYEGQPMVLLEAAAAGLPALVSDLGSLPETVGLGRGWSVPAAEPAAWREALALVADDARVDGAGRRVRALYEQRYRPESGLRQLEAALGRAIRQARQAR